MSQTIDIVVQLTGLSAIVTVPAVQLPSNGNGGPVTWEQVTGKPSTFPPSAHQHVMDDVQGLISALAGKAASIHTHQIADTIGLALALADKANVSDLPNKADLVDGVIPTEQIPAIAIVEFLGDVANEAAMLALVGQRGDWCIRTDENLSYVIVGNDPTLIASWRHIETPGSPVTSVNGQTGTVVLGKASVGLGNVDNTSDMQKPVSTAQAAALAGKANTSHNHEFGEIINFELGVMSTKLPTFSAGITDPVVTGDILFDALRKLQGQINLRATIAQLNSIAALNKRIVVVSDSTTTVTGTQTNTLIRTIAIPGGWAPAGSIIRVRSRTRKLGSGGTYTQRLYINTSEDLTGANHIGTHTSAAIGQLYNQMRRDLVIKSATQTEVPPPTPSMSVDEAQQSGAVANYNIDWSVQQFLIVAIQLGNGADTGISSYMSIDLECNTAV
jgi:hypothetical protein